MQLERMLIHLRNLSYTYSILIQNMYHIDIRNLDSNK